MPADAAAPVTRLRARSGVAGEVGIDQNEVLAGGDHRAHVYMGAHVYTGRRKGKDVSVNHVEDSGRIARTRNRGAP